MALSDDYIVGTGNHWRIERGWESLTGNNNDQLPTSGLDIPYYQETTNRRSYVSTDGVGGSKAVKMVLTPVGQTNIDGNTESVSVTNQVWNSGIGLGSTSLSGLDCVEGDEIWAKCDIFLSSNWSWGPSSGSSLKLMRLYPSSYYEGELIAQVDQDGLVYAQTQGFTGGNLNLYTGASSDCSGATFSYPIGQWFRLEMYMKVSSDPATARCRMWIDGVLRLDRNGNTAPYTGLQTLNRTGNTNLLGSPGLVLYSTWDAGASLPNGQQYIIYDNIVVTNDKTWVQNNGELDSYNNLLIGNYVGTSTYSTEFVSPNIYNSVLDDLAKGNINFDADIFYVILTNGLYAFNPDESYRSEIVAKEVIGTGYVSGGQLVDLQVLPINEVTRVLSIQGSVIDWTSSSITAYGAIVYKYTGNISTDKLIFYRKFDTPVMSNTNGLLSVDLTSPVNIYADSTGRDIDIVTNLKGVTTSPTTSSVITGTRVQIDLVGVSTLPTTSTASAGGVEILSETFYDTNLITRNWYDGVSGSGLDSHYSIVTDSDLGLDVLQITWTDGDANDTNISPLRHLFNPTDDITISYRVKYSSNWDFSVSNIDRDPRRLINILSDRDGIYDSSSYNYGNLRIDTDDAGVVTVRWWDSKAINTNSYEGSPFITDSWPRGNDLTHITSNRSSGLCNTQIGRDINGNGIKGECFLAGSDWWNYQRFTGSDFYFLSNIWYDIKVRCKMNTVNPSDNSGNYDGVIKIEYKLSTSATYATIYHNTKLNLRNGDLQGNLKFNQLLLAPFRPEGGVHPTGGGDVYMRVSNVKIRDNTVSGVSPILCNLKSVTTAPISSSVSIDTDGVVDGITHRGRYWTIRRGWESFQAGSIINPTNPLTYIASSTYNRNSISYNNYYRGSRSLELKYETPTIDGSNAMSTAVSNNRVGLIASPSDTCYEGDKVWFRAWIYLKDWSWTPTDLNTNFEIIKIRTTPYDQGELILATNYTANDSNVQLPGSIRALLTGYPGDDLELIGSNFTGDPRYCGAETYYPINEWFCLEAFVQTSVTPSNCRVRVWLNGERILSRSGNGYNTTSLNSSSTTQDIGGLGFILSHSWSPTTTLTGISRVMYIDDIIMTNDPELATAQDSSGYYMIGMEKV